MKHTIPALLLIALLAGCGGQDAPVVRTADPATRIDTELGTVEGYVDEAGAHVWLGLPYAAPPVGDLRWRAPRAARSLVGRARRYCIRLGVPPDRLAAQRRAGIGPRPVLGR